MVEITKSEAESLMEFIEINIFDSIRKDEAIDGMAWLCNLTAIFKKCKEAVENDKN